MISTLRLYRNRIVGHDEISPSELVANPKNWRLHPKLQQDTLDEVLSAVGWVQNVVVNRQTGHVIDGHLRISLAIRRGEPVVPVIYVDLDENEEALVLATLDPLSALAEADASKLDALLQLIPQTSAAVQQMLSELAEKAGLLPGGDERRSDPGPQFENAERLQVKWGTERGQLWEIGYHRLLCGDATVQADVLRLLNCERPHLCVTDPPYGVNYDPGWRNIAAAAGHLSYGGRRVGKVTNDDRADWSAAWRLVPGDVIYSWHPPGATSLVHAAALQASGFVIRMQIIWAKSNFPIGRGDYHVRHEPCWYAVREGKPSKRTGDRTQTTLWEINLDHNVDGGHSTQKPLECMARPIRNHEGDVYDPFVGSGTTMVAAEQLGRRCFALEIEPKYCAVTLERLSGMGLSPKLHSTVAP